jgi:hypothetical protein
MLFEITTNKRINVPCKKDSLDPTAPDPKPKKPFPTNPNSCYARIKIVSAVRTITMMSPFLLLRMDLEYLVLSRLCLLNSAIPLLTGLPTKKTINTRLIMAEMIKIPCFALLGTVIKSCINISLRLRIKMMVKTGIKYMYMNNRMALKNLWRFKLVFRKSEAEYVIAATETKASVVPSSRKEALFIKKTAGF